MSAPVTPPPVGQAAPAKQPLIWSASCACCEAVTFMLTPALPEDWRTQAVGFATYAYCPDCAVDLPKGRAR